MFPVCQPSLCANLHQLFLLSVQATCVIKSLGYRQKGDLLEDNIREGKWSFSKPDWPFHKFTRL